MVEDFGFYLSPCNSSVFLEFYSLTLMIVDWKLLLVLLVEGTNEGVKPEVGVHLGRWREEGKERSEFEQDLTKRGKKVQVERRGKEERSMTIVFVKHSAKYYLIFINDIVIIGVSVMIFVSPFTAL